MIGATIISGIRAFISGKLQIAGTVPHQKQLLVDISILWRRDAGTGIQRVVRALSEQLTDADIGDYKLCFVAATRRQSYCYLEPDSGNEGRLHMAGRIKPGFGDIFLGLDLSSRILPRHERQVKAWRKKGARICIVVYDLLPARHPQWFGYDPAKHFVQWLHFIGRYADQALCISRTVAQDLDLWLRQAQIKRSGTIDIHAFPLGGDLHKSRPTQGMTDGDAADIGRLKDEKFLLMVGTIEPRKGHAVALDAFDQLCRSGQDDIPALVIVGRPGWKSDEVQAKIRSHPKRGKTLFWFEDASDELLDRLYTLCAGVFFPTFAEGFGLPVAESLAHGRPVLVRDIPVFRELSSPLVSYFSDDEPVALAQSVLDWLEDIEKEQKPCQQVLLTWQKSCEVLLGHMKISNRFNF